MATGKNSLVPGLVRRVRRPWLAMAVWLGMCTLVLGQDSRDRDASGVGGSSEGSAQGRYLAPGGQTAGAWKLGILSRNTDTGVLITQVQSGSVAQRSGLEANDVIVNVAGYQVGIVEGRLYDIADELARRVDGRGRVNLLVRNSRDGKLVNVPVVFGSSLRSVTGEISTSDRYLVSSAAVLTVRLLDITKPQWNDVSIAEVRMDVPRKFPVNYRVEFDPALLRSGHRYGVQARVTDRGQTILQNAQVVEVNVAGGNVNANVRMALGGRPGSGAILPSLLINQWYSKYLGRQPNAREASVWEGTLSRSGTPEEIQAALLSSTEYYEQQGNDPDRYIDAVYQELTGKKATADVHRSLRRQLDQQGQRLKFVEDLIRKNASAG